jgi:hypothetical protein
MFLASWFARASTAMFGASPFRSMLIASLALGALLTLAASGVTLICDSRRWSPSCAACRAVRGTRAAIYSLHRPLEVPEVYRRLQCEKCPK